VAAPKELKGPELSSKVQRVLPEEGQKREQAAEAQDSKPLGLDAGE
jgi:hypothetical protein